MPISQVMPVLLNEGSLAVPADHLIPLYDEPSACSNNICPYCEKVLPIDSFGGDHYRGFLGIDHKLYCNERCETLSQADLRWLLRDLIAGKIPTRENAVSLLSRFGHAFEVIKDATEGVL